MSSRRLDGESGWESGTLPPDGVRTMFDRIAPVYDVMNHVMTMGLDRRWRRLTVEAVVQPGARVLDACCGTGDLAIAAEREGGIVTGLDFSGEMLARARGKSNTIEWVQGDVLALPQDDGSFDAATVGFGVRNVADLRAALLELRRVLRPGGRLAILEITQPRGPLRPFFSLWFDRVVPLLGRALPGGKAYAYLPASVRRFPGAEAAREPHRRVRVRRSWLPPLRRLDRRLAHGNGPMSATLEVVRAAPGLGNYLAEVEELLEQSVAGHPGLVAEVGAEALTAGGKRLRPMLTFFSAPPGAGPSVAAGAAVELVHMATLVHDDLIDGARVRRGRAAAWTAYGVDTARAAGDYLFARAFAELAKCGDVTGVAILADASLALARGEALQRRQRHDPATTVDGYLERCALKTGKLFEAACLLGGGSGDYGRLLGVSFQIVDDILDCAGDTIETGKIPGTDLRDGTPTLPLLLAAQEDEVVRAAIAGGPLEGVLLRVAATGALERSREVALDYATRARASLTAESRRHELESLANAVVDRNR